jgi:hypothetical protein
MKRNSIALAICFAIVCTACIGFRGSAFYSNFSAERLVKKNLASAGLACDPNGGGGGGGIGGSSGGLGLRGGAHSHSFKGDGFACRLTSDSLDRFDEARLIDALRLDVEKALSDNGAKIIDRGNPGPASFYFAYTLENIQGRVQISGKRTGGDFYSVQADLVEDRK